MSARKDWNKCICDRKWSTLDLKIFFLPIYTARCLQQCTSMFSPPFLATTLHTMAEMAKIMANRCYDLNTFLFFFVLLNLQSKHNSHFPFYLVVAAFLPQLKFANWPNRVNKVMWKMTDLILLSILDLNKFELCTETRWRISSWEYVRCACVLIARHSIRDTRR